MLKDKKPIRKIYTRTGDTTTTGILGGFRLTKHSLRIESLGSLDELNSFLGFLLSLSTNIFKNRQQKKIAPLFRKILEQIQRDLFVIGADLSSPFIRNNTIPHPLARHFPNAFFKETAKKVPQISYQHVHILEDTIDHFQKLLPPVKNFILPQGNPVGAMLQVVRSIARRAERRAVQLAVHSKVNPMILAYLNRLSDLFFVLARAVNYKGKQPEKIWKHASP